MSLLSRLAGTVLRRPSAPPPLPAEAWFDALDADDQVDERAADPSDRATLRSFVRDGYAVVPGVVPDELIDGMLAELDAVFAVDEPYADLEINDLVLAGGHRATVSHDELVSLPKDARLAARDDSSWRLHGFFRHSPAADQIRELPELRRLASMILGVDAHANYSINFRNGSRQALHEDSAVFHLGVPNLICGAWIACEDLEEGCGPLVFLPGSHRRDRFGPFGDDPKHNLRTATPEVSAAYRGQLDAAAEQYERHTFLARKGDVLLWHGMLIHGGEPIQVPALTRKSYVLHYIPQGADVADTVTGPTNW